MAEPDKRFEIIKSMKGNPLLIYDGYTYRKWREIKDGVEWKCTKEKAKCYAALKTYGDEVISYKSHICVKDKEEIEVRKALTRCRERAKQDLDLPIRQIFDEETSELVERGFHVPKFNNIKSAISAIRRKTRYSLNVCKTKEQLKHNNEVNTLETESQHEALITNIKTCDSSTKKMSAPIQKRDLNEINKTFEITKTNRGKECLLHEGFVYRKIRERDSYVMWKCIRERTSNCHSTLKTHKGQIIECKAHACSSDIEEVEVRKFINNCKKLVEINLQTPVWEIYQEESRDLVERGFIVPKYSNIKTTLNKIRRRSVNNASNLIFPVDTSAEYLSECDTTVQANITSLPLESPNVNLSWTSHSKNMQSMFLDLLNSAQFIDVTISCEGKSIKCHRAVLAMCSQYFDSVFKQFPCDHPIILVPNIGFWELQSLVDFMYSGQLKVPYEKLPTLIEAATVLEINSLINSRGEPASPLEDVENHKCGSGIRNGEEQTTKRKWDEKESVADDIKRTCRPGLSSLTLVCEPDMLSHSKGSIPPLISPKRRRSYDFESTDYSEKQNQQHSSHFVITDLSSGVDLCKTNNYGLELPTESSRQEMFSEKYTDKKLDVLDVNIRPECCDSFEVFRSLQLMQQKYNIT